MGLGLIILEPPEQAFVPQVDEAPGADLKGMVGAHNGLFTVMLTVRGLR